MNGNVSSDITLIFLKSSGRGAALQPCGPYGRAVRAYFASVAQL